MAQTSPRGSGRKGPPIAQVDCQASLDSVLCSEAMSDSSCSEAMSLTTSPDHNGGRQRRPESDVSTPSWPGERRFLTTWPYFASKGSTSGWQVEACHIRARTGGGSQSPAVTHGSPYAL
jgi:hypothetical protein